MKIEDIVLNNKYSKWYFSICNNARNRAATRKEAKNILGLVEGHHILPKSILSNSDIVYVSVKEHFVLHHLLTKMLTGKHKTKMIYAFNMFLEGRNLTQSQRKLCLSHKHFPCDNERKKNISKSRKNTIKLKCPHCSKESDPGNYKQYHGDNCKNNPDIDIEVLLKRSNSSKAGIKKAILNGNHKPGNLLRKNITCIHCNKTGTNWLSMKRHHFDNCKTLNKSSISSSEALSK